MEEPVLKPALQLWLENDFIPSLKAVEAPDNPGRHVWFKVFHSSYSFKSPVVLSRHFLNTCTYSPVSLTIYLPLRLSIFSSIEVHFALYIHSLFEPHSISLSYPSTSSSILLPLSLVLDLTLNSQFSISFYLSLLCLSHSNSQSRSSSLPPPMSLSLFFSLSFFHSISLSFS